MKKQLLALAIGSALVLPAVSSAADKGPTVYGKVNVSYSNKEVDPDDGTGSDDQYQLDSNASRLGVKGSFDLDVSGLQAIYQAEYELNVDDGDKGDTAFSQRNIFVGIKSATMGTLRAGKFDTPMKESQGKFDQFNDLDADIKSLLAGETREANIVAYTSPKLADMLLVNVALVPGEGKDFDGDGNADTRAADGFSSSIVFDKDNFYAAIAYDKDMPGKGSLDQGGFDRADILRLVGMIKLDAVELGLLLENAQDAGSSDAEDNSYLVSGAYKLDRFKFKLQLGQTDGDQSDDQRNLYAVGLDYKLGKNSLTYLYYANLTTDLDAGNEPENTTIGIGIEHKFSM